MIALNISHKFHNKTNLDGEYAKGNYSSSFHPADLTPDELIAHATSGKAWTLHRFDGVGRKGDTWVSSQLVALDLDDTPRETAEVARHPFVAKYALVVYPTPSSSPDKPKNRVVFLLDDTLTHAGRWQAIQRGLLKHFADWKPDPACKDLARLFYGSDKPGYVVIGQTLPLTVAGSLTAYEAYEDDIAHDLEATRTDAPGTTIMLEGDRLKAYAEATFNRTIDDLRTTTDERNPALYKAAISLFSKAMGGWGFTEGQVESALLEAMHVNGYTAQKGEHKTRSTLESALKAATPEALPVLDDTTTPKTATPEAQADALGADITFNSRFVGDFDGLPDSGVLMLVSDTGTGKTRFAEDMVKRIKAKQGVYGVLATAPLKGLTAGICERLKLEKYDGLNRDQRRQAIDLGICTPSMAHLPNGVQGGGIPAPKVFILDEVSKILESLSSKTIYDEAGKATRVFSVLKHLIQTTPHVLIMDADLPPVVVRWVKSLRGDVTVAVNTYRRECGIAYEHKTPESVENAASNAVAEDKGTVVIVSDSKNHVEAMGEYYTDLYGEDAVLTIHRDNSSDPAQQRFFEAPGEVVGQYRVVILSPSAMTGVDIDKHIYKKFAIFTTQEIDATGCRQLLERARYADETHFYIRHIKNGKRPTNAQTIYKKYLHRAMKTKQLVAVNPNGGLDFDGVLKELHLLQSELLAERNRSLNSRDQHFKQLIAGNYDIRPAEAVAGNAEKSTKEARKTIKERRRELTLTVDPITPQEHGELCAKGQRTEAHNAGLTRHNIEDFYKTTITGELYDFDAGGKGRAKVTLYADVFLRDQRDLEAIDARDIADNAPIMRRRNRAMRQRTVKRLLLAVWGNRDNFNADHQIALKDIEDRVTAFLDEHGNDLKLYLHHRADHSDDPLKVLQRLLRAMGLKLVEHRQRDPHAPKLYKLDRESMTTMGRIAGQRIEGIEAERENDDLSEKWGERVTKKRIRDIQSSPRKRSARPAQTSPRGINPFTGLPDPRVSGQVAVKMTPAQMANVQF